MSAPIAERIRSARTMLFVPGTRPDRFDRAFSAGADAIILDLEDAVAPPEKELARSAVAAWLDGVDRDGPAVLVRVNASSTVWHEQDLETVRRTQAGVMLPKAESAREVAATVEGLRGRPVVALVETASAVLGAQALAEVPGVERLALGHVDLAAELGLDPASHAAFHHARSRLVLASAAAGLPSPVDGVTTTLEDEDALVADMRHALELGLEAKLCIHPRQVPVIHRVLAPTEQQVAWADGVLSASKEGGVVTMDGQMVDAPVVARARRIRQRAGRP